MTAAERFAMNTTGFYFKLAFGFHLFLEILKSQRFKIYDGVNPSQGTLISHFDVSMAMKYMKSNFPYYSI